MPRAITGVVVARVLFIFRQLCQLVHFFVKIIAQAQTLKQLNVGLAKARP